MNFTSLIPARFRLFHRVPTRVRPTYYHDLIASLWQGTAMSILAPGIAEFLALRALGAEAWQISLLVSLQGVGMVFAFYWGHLASERPKMPYVFGPRFCGNFLLIPAALVSEPIPFVLLVGSANMIRMFAIPAQTALRRLNYPAEIRGTIVGYIEARRALMTSAFAAIIGEILEVDAGYFRIILPLMGLAGIVSAFRMRRIVIKGDASLAKSLKGKTKESAPARLGRSFAKSVRDSYLCLARDGRFRIYMLCFLVFGFANLMLRPVLPMFLDDQGANYRDVAWALGVIPTVMPIFTLGMWGRLVDRMNPVLMRAICNSLFMVEPFLIFAFPWLLPGLERVGVGIVGLVFFSRLIRGFAQGGGFLLWNLSVMYFAPRRSVSVYMGVHMMLTGIRFVAGPFVGIGFVSWIGYQWTFFVCGAFMLISIIGMFALAFRERRGGRFIKFSEAERYADEKAASAIREIGSGLNT